jgi:hypothetical protein
MAVTSKVLFRGAASTSSVTLYTAGSTTTAVVTNIGINNASTSEVTASLLLDDVTLVPDVKIGANSVVFIDLKQVVEPNDTIKGFASSASVNFHISGVEVV